MMIHSVFTDIRSMMDVQHMDFLMTMGRHSAVVQFPPMKELFTKHLLVNKWQGCDSAGFFRIPPPPISGPFC